MKHTIIAIAIRQCYAWHGTRIVSALSLPSVKRIIAMKSRSMGKTYAQDMEDLVHQDDGRRHQSKE